MCFGLNLMLILVNFQHVLKSTNLLSYEYKLETVQCTRTKWLLYAVVQKV